MNPRDATRSLPQPFGRGIGATALFGGLLAWLIFEDNPMFSLPPEGSWYSVIWFGLGTCALVSAVGAIFLPAVEIDDSEFRIRHSGILKIRVPRDAVTDLRVRREHESFLVRITLNDHHTHVPIRLPRGTEWTALERDLRAFVGFNER